VKRKDSGVHLPDRAPAATNFVDARNDGKVADPADFSIAERDLRAAARVVLFLGLVGTVGGARLGPSGIDHAK
jgi:hypothetical protein